MVATRCKEVFFGIFMEAMETILYAAFTVILALGGSIVGTIAGGIKGQTTEAGFLDGAGKGAVTGAIAAIELLNFRAIDDPLTKALMSSLLNGKIFMEWICPAVAQAYHLHMNTAETSSQREVSSNIYENKGVTGMAQSVILKLPFQKFKSNKKLMYMSSCSICFQDFEDEELIRILPKCGHIFHLQCIDKWLIQQGSCPMCRTHVSSYHIHDL
ncbi:NEP1-interacting protein 2 isoform X1 [Arachis duranensis]|uniref:NEP1-interacting protein 2 isoform X1 n=1 Tax=Arachis duranensis TaxID=130453 RepID=A0A6P4DT29_ARADU|nr:NEP1-interacting protein 2 isoform X1 [Arachis duranensis]